MFTVKWSYERDGGHFERIFEAETVDVGFDNRGPGTGQASLEMQGRHVPPNGLVVLDGYSTLGMSFDCGKLYVMNDKGSTVGSYDLGPVIGGTGVPPAPQPDVKPALHQAP